MNVKAYQDGTRFVMVFEDCTPDITECLKAFIKPVMEAQAEAAVKAPVKAPVTGYGSKGRSKTYEKRGYLKSFWL